ncbi:MAG: hypothetical protein AAGB05_01375, partial [Pseudomonadota bacterium]
MGRRKWYDEEIEWGKELADHIGAGYREDDYWQDEFEDDSLYDGPTEADQRYDRLMLDLRAIVPEGATPESLLPKVPTDDAQGLIDDADALAGELATASLERLRAADPDIARLADRRSDLESKAEGRSARAAKIAAVLIKLSVPDGAEESEVTALNAIFQTARDALDVAPRTDVSLQAAEDAVRRAVPMRGAIVTAIEARKREHDRIAAEALKITDTGRLKDHKALIKEKRDALTDALKPPITTARNEAADTALGVLRETVETCKTELEALGGGDAVEKLCTEFGIDEDAFNDLEAAIGDRKALTDTLKAFSPAELGALCKTFGAGLDGAKALGPLMKDMGGATKVKQTIAALGGGDKLAGLAKTGGLDGAGILKICDDLGAGLLGALMGSSNDPAVAIGLQAKIGTDMAAFKTLQTDSGLGGKPKAMAALLTTGCSGNLDDFKDFCLAFTTPEARASLKGVVETGGLGDAPEALGAFVAEGCGGKADFMKTFADSFDDDAKRQGLARLMDKGGLKGEVGKVSEKTLAEVFKHIGGEKPDGVTDDVFAKTRADKMATLVSGLDEAACGALKTTLGDGGLGTDPAVVGHLLGTGCDAAPGQVGPLMTELSSHPMKLAALKSGLQKGGLGTVDETGAATGTDPRTLAFLVKDGCDGTPGKLTTLLTNLGDTGRADLKGMLKEGGLGTDPEVFGHLIGLGCDKGDPTKFNALTAELAKDADNTKALKAVLQQGGLGTKDDSGTATKINAKCLGKLLDPGCDGKPKQIVELLTQLNDSGANPGALGNLKGVMTTGGLGTYPDVFGDLYKQGCLKNADGPADGTGDKEPKVLIQMIGAFGGAPAEFKDLLENGKFNKRSGDGKISRLASVMRYGLEPKDGSDKDGADLKELFNSFSGQMPKLDTMMDTLEIAPDWILEEGQPGAPNQPGKGLRNMVYSPGISGDPSRMCADVYDIIIGTAPSTAGMTDKELLQHAASFEHQRVDPTAALG